MGTPEGRRPILDWPCMLVRTSEVNVFVGTQMQETKSTDRPARSARAFLSTVSSTPHPTSRDGLCAARRSVGHVMKPKLPCGSSRHPRLSWRAAGTSSIRVRAVLVLETGCGARNATRTWFLTKDWDEKCAFTPASSRSSRAERIREVACSSVNSRACTPS